MRVISYSRLKPEKGIGFSRESIRRLVKEKKFPAPLDLGDRSIAWPETELDEWLETRAALRSQQKAA